MAFPFVTSVYAALLALLYLALSAWVSAGRTRLKVMLGDGGDANLLARIRAHANFAEYVPLILILVALLEGRRTSIYIIHALLFTLLVARLAHPIGIVAAPGSAREKTFRGLGAGLTYLVLLLSAVALLVAAIQTPIIY